MAKPRALQDLRISQPPYVEGWFEARGWQPHPYPGAMVEALCARHSTLLIAPVPTGLIYGVLRRHEPDHILLQVARRDAKRELPGLKRLSDLLTRFQDRWLFMPLSRPSPFSIPVLTDVPHRADARRWRGGNSGTGEPSARSGGDDGGGGAFAAFFGGESLDVLC